jgi:tRNA nucleotidyltransferase/poly(A) polymerase
MHDAIAAVVAGEEAYVVGGAVRDELLGRPVVDVDVACREPERAAARLRQRLGGATFLLSERHGAWRVALRDGRTFDFTLLAGTIDEDLGGRDFTANAIAVPVGGDAPVDPFGGQADLERRILRAVSPGAFEADPLRLLRAVRLEDELGLAIEPGTAGLIRTGAGEVARPAGERVLTELQRLSAAGWRRLDELGMLAPLGGSTDRLDHLGDDPSPQLLLVAALGDAVFELPLSNETRRFARKLLAAARPPDASPRSIHRFRRATEPWALDALKLLAAGELASAVVEARASDPPAPLVRGDELQVGRPSEIGRLLARIAEERAAGTISTREEALELVRREAES